MNQEERILRLPRQGEIRYVVRRSARARRVRVTVGASGVLLVVPERVGLPRAESFLASQSDWIVKRLEAWDRRKPTWAVPVNHLLLFAEPIPLRIEASLSPRGRPLVHRSHQEIHLRVPGGRADLAVQAIESWMRKLAARHFKDSVGKWTAEMGVQAGSVSIRGQRSRWGSCTAKGALSFNWKALLTPPETVEYLVVHECAHLLHMNHGPGFWRCVARHCPNFLEHKDRLRQSGHLLEANRWIDLSLQTGPAHGVADASAPGAGAPA